MRVASRPEAVGEPEEVSLVDRAQHLGHRTLDDLVFQSGDTKWATAAVGLGDGNTPNRTGRVASRVDAPMQVLQVRCEVPLVRLHGDPIDSRRCAPSLSIERSPRG